MKLLSKLSSLQRFHLLSVLLCLLITGLFLLEQMDAYHWRFVDRMDSFLYDRRVVLSLNEGIKDDRIVMLDINEQSLMEVGRWPWGRDRMADLVNILFDRHAVRMVVFDLIFREEDLSSGLNTLENLAKEELAQDHAYHEKLPELRKRLDYDQLFSESMQKGPVILAYTFFSEQEEGRNIRDGALPLPVIQGDALEGKQVFAPQAAGYGGNIHILHGNSIGGGHITPTTDEDGMIRRVPLLVEYQGDYYESLSLAIARTMLGVFEVEPVFADMALEGSQYPPLEALRLGKHKIPVDANVQTLIPYRTRDGSFPVVSAADVLHGRADTEQLQGRVILVGSSSKGLVDLRSTPVNKSYPAMQIHAELVAGMLDGNILSMPAWTKGANFLLLLLVGVALSMLLPFFGPTWSAAMSLLALSAVFGSHYVAWTEYQLILSLASPLLLILALFFLDMSLGYFHEQFFKSKIIQLFGRYVPPELVNEMSEDPNTYTQDAKQVELTVLFSDVRSFTTISEALEPAELSALMKEYLSPMTHLIHENRGTIDKYIGDAVMAFWGAPLDDPKHAHHALNTGLAMLRHTEILRKEFAARGWPEIRIGIGLNTGVMSVGDMGSEFRQAYTVLGDAVNLGARLEGLTKSYGMEIIISEFTRRAAPQYICRELDLVRVKGKDKPVAIYEPLGEQGGLPAEWEGLLEQHTEAFACYRTQQWREAEQLFQELLRQEQQQQRNGKIYEIYLGRIAGFRASPPGEDWDGVFTHTTK